MGGYRSDREWAEKYMGHVKQIVGPYLLEPTNAEMDQTEASDLILLTARDLRVACRVRRPGYADRYPDEFTVRSRRDSGVMTELEKMTNGFADWMFYGHAHPVEFMGVERWVLVDLGAWRAAMIRDRSAINRGEKPNNDGTYFCWFSIPSFPRGGPRNDILIASSHPVPNYEDKCPNRHAATA